ncbi:hypothetical protein [Hymenobacter cavernae]|uniref:Uncharacterized protein n=1 Tax=Hymenobacter cavernae TaxID=2044852 RepID=A0ABQ1TU63_9BACT|nr:hypothetical protein [Hymenobacter cavernae]GGF03592.1 hypothetical protein GCM10011383_13290 [Hymenobacter cavernae]
MIRWSRIWLIGWLVFYAGVLPKAVPICLDWMSRSSTWRFSCGILGMTVLAVGVAFSLYQAGRALTRHFFN